MKKTLKTTRFPMEMEQWKILQEQKRRTGATIWWQLTKALEMYIKTLNYKQ